MQSTEIYRLPPTTMFVLLSCMLIILLLRFTSITAPRKYALHFLFFMATFRLWCSCFWATGVDLKHILTYTVVFATAFYAR